MTTAGRPNPEGEISAAVFPFVPPPAALWRAFIPVVWVLLGVWMLDGLVDLFVQYWLNSSLGFRTIFWTKIRAQATLFSLAGATLGAAAVLPVRRTTRQPDVSRAILHVGAWAALVGGRLFAGRYDELLLARFGGSFEAVDPVFGNDIGFYVFRLPLVWTLFELVWLSLLVAMASYLVGRYASLREDGVLTPGLGPVERLGLLLSPGFNTLFYALGFLGAAGTWLTRYALLHGDNEASGVRAGAEAVDVTGLFSTLNAIRVTVGVEIGVTLVVGYTLWRLNAASQHLESGGDPGPRMSWRIPCLGLVALLALDAGFYLAVAVRDRLAIVPNEPYIQREYIERHMSATRRGYGLEEVEVVEWPVPDRQLSPTELLESRTVQNAPVLPGYVSYVESRSPDLRQARRFDIVGTTMLYGPMLEIYEQQQQLRPYYGFLDVDAVRYRIDGERRMYVSAVREIPSLSVVGPQAWLEKWGTATLLYTHGMGLTMSPANQVTAAGEPVYVLEGIPPRTEEPAFEVAQPRIYYGEGGTGSYVLTNIRHLEEFDYATEQSRATYVLPPSEPTGIRIDGLFKRLVIGLWSVTRAGNDLPAFLFSDFIDHERTRIHLKRSPLERARAVAPFLFLDDSNIYAVMADGRISWLINALTTTDEYPYSLSEELGDKATDRSPEELRFPTRRVNYAEDSVKVTLDAFSGALRFYKMTDAPIIEAWSAIFPDLFTPAAEMPAAIEQQLTYPLQWFHVQFDDIYKRYHQKDYVEFYNLEDLWDDADEVVGPIGVGLEGFGTRDEATFSYEADPLLLDLADLPGGAEVYGEERDLQFARVMPFTPEGARNLRSLIVAFQDPGRYGRLYSIRVPQGIFVPGPEQADAMIDADARVNQQLTLWVRHGAQVLAGHTLLLPVRGHVMYVEPIWVKSSQNAIPQIRLFAVVYRDKVTMAANLRDAIRLQGRPDRPPGLDLASRPDRETQPTREE